MSEQQENTSVSNAKCDARCPAEAAVRWETESGEMFTCIHHAREWWKIFNENPPKFRILGFWIVTGEPYDEFSLWDHTPEEDEEKVHIVDVDEEEDEHERHEESI